MQGFALSSRIVSPIQKKMETKAILVGSWEGLQ
jgi:hypothetical protein